MNSQRRAKNLRTIGLVWTMLLAGCPTHATSWRPGTACGEYREACTNKVNDDPSKPILTCLANLFGRGGGDGDAEFGLCDSQLLQTVPKGVAVTIEGNVLAGAAIGPDDPLVTKITDADPWLMSGDSLQAQLLILQAAKTGVHIDIGTILSSISAASSDNANVAVPGQSLEQAVGQWRERCGGRGYPLGRMACQP